MTSKEALNRLYNHLQAILEEDAPELIRIIKSYYDIVEKDLEALEIFIKFFSPEYCNYYEFNNGALCLDGKIYISPSEEQIIKDFINEKKGEQ